MRPKHFTIAELVDPAILQKHGEEECWKMLDPKILTALDFLRDKFGKTTVNGMYLGHKFTESGLRRKDTATGAPNSTHKLGQGMDAKMHDVEESVVYDWILANQAEAYRVGIRRVEDIAFTGRKGGGGWLHIDCKDTGPDWVNKIQVVKPKK